jgi:hypothetical protein
MRGRRNAGRGAVATRVFVALVAVGGCLGAVAYATDLPHRGGARPAGLEVTATATQRSGSPSWNQRQKMNTRLPRPQIGKRPEAVSTVTTARFTFSASHEGLRFQCRLDGARWKRCGGSATYSALALGKHSFSVRSHRRAHHSGASIYRWILVEPKPFSIEPQLADLGDLYPGAGAVALPVRLSNPNSVRIVITALRVGVSADPPGCDSATNIELIPSSASTTAPLTLPAGGSVTLPATGVSAPAIALRDLPVSQDACQGAQLPLFFSGEAHG